MDPLSLPLGSDRVDPRTFVDTVDLEGDAPLPTLPPADAVATLEALVRSDQAARDLAEQHLAASLAELDRVRPVDVATRLRRIRAAKQLAVLELARLDQLEDECLREIHGPPVAAVADRNR